MRVFLQTLTNRIPVKFSDADIRFTFITGVTKFSNVSLFSGLNNLNDITLDPRYSAICGYTDADLDDVFAAELPGSTATGFASGTTVNGRWKGRHSGQDGDHNM